MEVESVKCECCGLREDCTQEYIRGVRANFEGKWLCGLCSEAVRDEAIRSGGRKDQLHHAMDEALQEHITFCTKFRANPAVLVADGMRQMLRRRSGDHLSTTPSKNFRRSSSTL
ncbi:hypothetical protein IHE45_08G121400 [Dioscorea alata]|uniref:Uncharacterized protein n=1 Tax=Dioscorea alata TaxID=55571 RepID=A0ACB7VM18_DIOAL|nr:hypothetical protein IHE45_08G121400 [Dioscorea alata]